MIDLLKATLDYLIIGLLGLMSFFMVWFVVERWLYYRRVDLSRFVHPQELSVALTRHLTIVSSIGANAPYVGLLGTVLGMISVFTTLSAETEISSSMLAGGISEALVTTAAGLLVAVPTLISYNYFINRIQLLVVEMERISLRLVAVLKR